MIRDPDRSIARLVSRLCPASQRFIRFHRIFEASQFMRKALGKVETIGERHPLLPSFSVNARAVPLAGRMREKRPEYGSRSRLVIFSIDRVYPCILRQSMLYC